MCRRSQLKDRLSYISTFPLFGSQPTNLRTSLWTCHPTEHALDPLQLSQKEDRILTALVTVNLQPMFPPPPLAPLSLSALSEIAAEPLLLGQCNGSLMPHFRSYDLYVDTYAIHMLRIHGRHHML